MAGSDRSRSRQPPFPRAARELINSTAGVGGIEASKADFGQTLGKWGLGPGPYLVLPLLPPLTLRDGLGLGVDTTTNPLSYYTRC